MCNRKRNSKTKGMKDRERAPDKLMGVGQRGYLILANGVEYVGSGLEFRHTRSIAFFSVQDKDRVK